MQITNFLICGLLSLVFAAGLRQTWTSGKRALWGPVLLAIYGVGMIASGIFVTDPALGYPSGAPDGPATLNTSHGSLHTLGGIVVFSALSLVCFVLAPRFAGDSARKSWATYSLLTGILFMACFLAFIILGHVGGPAGLLERLAIGSDWSGMLAIRCTGAMAFASGG